MQHCNVIDRFRTNGIAVDWSTIAAGWEGWGIISAEEVIGYASDQLPDPPHDQLKWVTQLAIAEKDERELISQALHELAKGNLAVGVRKWRLLLLKELLPRIGDDLLYSLIELADFWSTFDYPDDSPHVVQGRGNSISPQEYYTEANLQAILDRHWEWVRNEEPHLA